MCSSWNTTAAYLPPKDPKMANLIFGLFFFVAFGSCNSDAQYIALLPPPAQFMDGERDCLIATSMALSTVMQHLINAFWVCL